jgi:hypothetical protein
MNPDQDLATLGLRRAFRDKRGGALRLQTGDIEGYRPGDGGAGGGKGGDAIVEGGDG